MCISPPTRTLLFVRRVKVMQILKNGVRTLCNKPIDLKNCKNHQLFSYLSINWTLFWQNSFCPPCFKTRSAWKCISLFFTSICSSMELIKITAKWSCSYVLTIGYHVIEESAQKSGVTRNSFLSPTAFVHKAFVIKGITRNSLRPEVLSNPILLHPQHIELHNQAQSYYLLRTLIAQKTSNQCGKKFPF